MGVVVKDQVAVLDALGVPPWREWERELDWFAKHLKGRADASSASSVRWAVEAELREQLQDSAILELLKEAELLLRWDALRKVVFEEHVGSPTQAPVISLELERLGSHKDLDRLYELAGTEPAQRLGYWWAKLQNGSDSPLAATA
jgi:hypothetical protein